jgi:hypothetical protein
VFAHAKRLGETVLGQAKALAGGSEVSGTHTPHFAFFSIHAFTAAARVLKVSERA